MSPSGLGVFTQLVYKLTHYQVYQASQSNGEAKQSRQGNKGLTQAYQIRDIAANALLELKDAPVPSLEDKVARASALRSLTYVWQEASERIRIIKGKPMPGSLRPIAKPKKVRTVSTKPLEQLPDSIGSKHALNNPLEKSDGDVTTGPVSPTD